MLFSSLVVAAIAGLASAQANFTTCCGIDPNSVTSDVRLSWCRAQQNTCPEICPNGQTSSNACDPNALTYSCTCLSGTTPNISSYGQTLPSLQCESWIGQCTAAHPNDLSGQTFCQSFQCGMKNASAVGAAASSASSSAGTASSTASGSSTGTASGASASSTTSKAAAAAFTAARDYGTGAVAMGLFAAFGLAL